MLFLTDTLNILASQGLLTSPLPDTQDDQPSPEQPTLSLGTMATDDASDPPLTPDNLVERVMAAFRMRHSRLLDLIEFQRPVHAEMSAITDAARRGIAVDGATLFTTT